MHKWIFPASLALLAGCSGGEEDGRAANEETAAPAPIVAAEATPSPPVSEGGDYEPDPSIKPPAAPDPGMGEGDRVIPQALRGRWGLVARDCTSERGDAKGLLTIDAATLRFYESSGELARIRERSASRLVADYKFSGEGMNWDRVMLLALEDDGTTLVRRDWGEGAASDPLRYTRYAQ